MSQHKFTVTAARGMLPLLAQELATLGIKQTRQDQGNIRFTGSLADAYRVCLWSRVAIRVLMPIAHFEAATPEALYEGVKAIPWEDHIVDNDSTLAVDFNHFRSKLKHKQYGAQRVKDGIVDRFREQTEARPDVDLYQPDVRVNVYVKHNQAIVSIDLSGESLHKRGYRETTTSAPLKEHLAAAILMKADWPKLANTGWGLLDPMCGSGTFLIEAALMAADIAPGLQRDYFGFLYWKQHDKAAWKQLKVEAERRRQSGLSRLPLIQGGDRDLTAVSAAQDNIAAAGLNGYINVEQCDLVDWPSKAAVLADHGLLVCNPPYGERIGHEQDLTALYQQLGRTIKQSLPSWRMSLITDNPDLAKHIGLTEYDRAPFDNGPIACQMLQFRAPRRASKSNPEVMKSNDILDEVAIEPDYTPSAHSEMFANRLKKNIKHLRKWANNNAISCYRIYDADLPDYAVAIDLYDDHVHVQEYAPPKQIDPDKALKRLQDVMHIVPDILNIPQKHVILKLRQKQRGHHQYEALSAKKQRFKVTESGLKFWVNLTDYLDTGLFLDHRSTRLKVAELARGRDFLNLFAYTGTATAYAAMGQAQSTTTVDMSNTYLAWAQDNMQLNGFTGQQHQFIRANCLEWLQAAQASSDRYGLIFLDPPTFSNSSRMEGVFDIQRDHVALIRMAVALLADYGDLIFSTNRRDFKLDEDALADLTLRNIHHKTLPMDFKRNPKIHACWLIKANNSV